MIRTAEGIPSAQRTVVCLGFFDGVHIGHARLIERAVEIARPRGLLVCVHTFDRSPMAMLRPEIAARELTLLPEKAALLRGLGADIVAVSPFDDEMARMRAEAFFHSVLIGKLRAAAVVAGRDHRFGFGGEADSRMLEALCHGAGIALTIIDPVRLPDGRVVSSTAIRQLLDQGDMASAEAMLGRAVKAREE